MTERAKKAKLRREGKWFIAYVPGVKGLVAISKSAKDALESLDFIQTRLVCDGETFHYEKIDD